MTFFMHQPQVSGVKIRIRLFIDTVSSVIEHISFILSTKNKKKLSNPYNLFQEKLFIENVTTMCHYS